MKSALSVKKCYCLIIFEKHSFDIFVFDQLSQILLLYYNTHCVQLSTLYKHNTLQQVYLHFACTLQYCTYTVYYNIYTLLKFGNQYSKLTTTCIIFKQVPIASKVYLHTFNYKYLNTFLFHFIFNRQFEILLEINILNAFAVLILVFVFKNTIYKFKLEV